MNRPETAIIAAQVFRNWQTIIHNAQTYLVYHEMRPNVEQYVEVYSHDGEVYYGSMCEPAGAKQVAIWVLEGYE